MAFDSSRPLLQAIADGDVDGSIIQDPYYMGYLGVYTLVRHIRGYDVNNGRTDMDQSTGEYLVTRENVGAVATLEKFDPEYQKARTMVPPNYRNGRAARTRCHKLRLPPGMAVVENIPS